MLTIRPAPFEIRPTVSNLLLIKTPDKHNAQTAVVKSNISTIQVYRKLVKYKWHAFNSKCNAATGAKCDCKETHIVFLTCA